VKVLITAATTSLAHKLKNQLINAEVVLGDHADLPVFMQKNIMKLPNPASDTYTHEMLALCLDNGIDELQALTRDEAATLLLSKQLFKEYNITIINGSHTV
jgi:hypothetical protein